MRQHAFSLSSSRRRAVAGALASTLLVLTAAAGFAAETAELLYSRGLVQYQRQQYAEALALFEQAVAVDAQDPYARYYRGVTYLQLERVPEGIADMRAALAINPDLAAADLELGVALVETDEFAEAIPHLERAQQALPEQAARAALFLGIARLRLGELDAAGGDLERAAADPELLPTARYYQGVVAFLGQRWEEAQAHFEFVKTAKPDTEIGIESQRFLERLHARQTKPYHLYATTGLEYDSNVALVPIDDAAQTRQGVSDEADGRVILGAGGVYVPWHNDWAQLSVGYDFFQSLQFDLTKFNLQNHRPSLQLAGRQGAFGFGAFVRYDIYLLGSRKFLQQGVGVPFVSYDEGDVGRTELFVRVRRRDFLRSPYSGALDSWNYSPGLRQILNLGTPQRSVWAGYRFDREDTLPHGGDSAFSYDGHELGVGLMWIFAKPFRADITYAFRYEDYDSESGGRDDYVHLPVAAVRWDITDHWGVALAYLGTFNDSNKDDFTYDRSIVSLSVTVSN